VKEHIEEELRNRVLYICPMKNTILLVAVLLATVVGVSRIDAQSPGPALGKNLIVNGDAEQGAGAPDTSEIMTIPGWTKIGHFNVVQYGASGGFAPGPANRGKNYFVGGPSNPQSAAIQTIDVSSMASKIDHDKLMFTFSAYLGGYAGQNDAMTLSASFENAKGSALRRVALGPVMAKDRNSVTGSIPRHTIGKVPAGTRSVLVKMLVIRTDGSYNDGSGDNLSLVFSLPSGGAK
jgi:hypothetical protein